MGRGHDRARASQPDEARRRLADLVAERSGAMTGVHGKKDTGSNRFGCAG